MEKTRELIFEIKEIKSNHDPYVGRTDYVHVTTGTVFIRGEEVTVLIDDKSQPDGSFISTDNKFKKILKAIHNFTK